MPGNANCPTNLINASQHNERGRFKIPHALSISPFVAAEVAPQR